MIVNLTSAKGPTRAVLNMLERLARRRAVFDVTPADEEEAFVIARALAVLDDMEECLCEEGARAPHLEQGWQVLEGLQERLGHLQATAPAAVTPAVAAAPPPPLSTTASNRRRPRPAIEARPPAGRRQEPLTFPLPVGDRAKVWGLPCTVLA